MCETRTRGLIPKADDSRSAIASVWDNAVSVVTSCASIPFFLSLALSRTLTAKAALHWSRQKKEIDSPSLYDVVTRCGMLGLLEDARLPRVVSAFARHARVAVCSDF